MHLSVSSHSIYNVYENRIRMQFINNANNYFENIFDCVKIFCNKIRPFCILSQFCMPISRIVFPTRILPLSRVRSVWQDFHQDYGTVLIIIMLTCPCNVDPLTPHFYIVKLGFTGGIHYFLIFVLKHRLWVLVRTASLRRSNVYPQSMYLAKVRKNIFFI